MSPLLRRALLWAAALLLAAGCGRAPAPATADAAPRAGSSAEESPRAEAEEEHEEHEDDEEDDEEEEEASDFSVYELETEWRDQEGRERTLASLGGKVRVVAMVYTHCAHTCPAILGEFKAMEAALSPEEKDRVGFVLVSIDPRRDTPERLREFAASTRLDPARWTLLTGGDDDVRELAALLAIRYRPEGETEFSHSNSYLVLDDEGRIVYRRDGLGLGIDEPLAHVRAAAKPVRAAR